MSTEKKSKKPKSSSAVVEPVGRYRGDLYTLLTHNPVSPKPFRVETWEWRGSFAYGATKEEQETCAWYSPFMIDGVKYQKDFRTVDGALRYLSRVRSIADRAYIMDNVRKANDEGYMRLV